MKKILSKIQKVKNHVSNDLKLKQHFLQVIILIMIKNGKFYSVIGNFIMHKLSIYCLRQN